MSRGTRLAAAALLAGAAFGAGYHAGLTRAERDESDVDALRPWPVALAVYLAETARRLAQGGGQ